MLYRSVLSGLILLLIASMASSQTFPQYDGVYVFNEDINDWVSVDLQPVGEASVAWSSNSDIDPRFKYNNLAGVYFAQSVGAIEVPILTRKNTLRIYVRQRNPSFTGIIYFVDASSMAQTIPAGDTVNSEGRAPGSIVDIGVGGKGPTTTFTHQYLFTGDSVSIERFRSRIIDEYSTEFMLESWTDISVPGFINCGSCDVEIQGFAIVTEDFRIRRGAESAFVVKIE